MLNGCASGPKVITEYEIKEIEVPVRTPLKDDLLEDPPGLPCIVPITSQFYFFDLDLWATCLEAEVDFYARQLEQIRLANEKPPEGG